MARFGAGWSPYGVLQAGVTANGVGLMLIGLAPGVAAVAATQALAGTGNAAEVVATDTIVQRVVPRPLLGRVFAAMATAAQAGSAIAYVAAAPLLGMLSPGVVLVAAGAGVLLTLAVLVPPLRRAARRPVEVENGSAAPVDP